MMVCVDKGKVLILAALERHIFERDEGLTLETSPFKSLYGGQSSSHLFDSRGFGHTLFACLYRVVLQHFAAL